MRADPLVENAPFAFAWETQVTAEQFARWQYSALLRRSKLTTFNLALFTIAGVIALTSWRTAALGIVVLLGATVGWMMPRWMKHMPRRMYLDTPYLHQPVTYSVDQAGFGLKGQSINLRSDWRGLRVWDVREDMFLLSASGMPAVYLPVAELERAGVYERVNGLAQRYGARFNSPEAMRR